MNTKFEFTGEIKEAFGIKLARIKAKMSFGDVKVGDVGGWIEKESNLDVYGNAWVYGNARVYGNALVSGNALVYGNARVSGDASPEEIARLDEVREIVLAKPKRLRMDGWHFGKWTPEHTPEEEHSCGSAHCIAGWLQALSPDKAIREMTPQAAGNKLAPSVSHMFYVSDSAALEWLKNREYAKSAEAA